MFELKECESILQKALNEGHSSLLIHEAQQICELHHIPTQFLMYTKRRRGCYKRRSDRVSSGFEDYFPSYFA
jgi:hypothetical protein